MTENRILGKELQGEILSTVRKSQEAVLDAIRSWADTVASLTPSIPLPSVPYADKLPRPEEFVSNAYDVAEQLLASQRRFAEEVVHATAQLLPGDGKANGTAAARRPTTTGGATGTSSK